MIEPCLYCGGEMVESVTGDYRCKDCGAAVAFCNIAVHNRIYSTIKALQDTNLTQVLAELIEATKAIDEWESGQVPSFFAFEVVKKAKNRVLALLNGE